ncbi:hypothetical protein THASP1DRAFT_27402 [Thamnocephalis sphaerospora]|uniref:PB1 domain-containing protein n=1 Tax=Thamnocephalis sphaerospora TaxID=78915 RepID=A0A4P9XWZ3_9FUNG|nr:hypothetical protein THASP1DRAFT_27402 [Thamnocephalis sphaerospora]|eukprot:RKP10807.1 hypothetical protein THASP1DRAFT_27402 [Thamnocephalis sphaerospora]
MSQPITVKILHGKIARRLVVPNDIAWLDLAAQVHGHFGLPGTVADVRLAYVDEEDDRVIFDTDAELREALHQVSISGKSSARFWVVPADDLASSTMTKVSTAVMVNGDLIDHSTPSLGGEERMFTDTDDCSARSTLSSSHATAGSSICGDSALSGRR